MRLKTKDELQAEKEAEKRAKQTKIDTTKLALLYCRQSTKEQTVKNKESALSQTVGAKKRATEEYGFSEEKLVLFIENALDQYGNKLDADKWRSVSGTLDKNFRAGLREAEQYIEADRVGAVFVDDVSRLFRDETGINPREFAQACKAHNVVVITEDREYDFNATAREDLKDFLEEADEAADYLKVLRRTSQRRREKKGKRGEFIGHPVPTGFMLDEERENYVPNPHWAPIVKKLTKRFRELDANFAALRNEVREQAIFPDLPQDFDTKRIGRIQLWKVPGGYTVLGHRSLVELLTNPVNIGHKTFKGHIVKESAHPAIVDIEDFQYALAHLGKTDLDGNEIEREKRARRFTQEGTKREGLLAGVREDGRPVVTSSQGAAVYVFQCSTGGAVYSIKDNHDLTTNPYRGSIALETLDAAISRRLEEKLNALTFYAEVERELGGNPKLGAQAILNHVALLKQKIQGSLKSVDATIKDIDKERAFRQAKYDREYELAKGDVSDEYIKSHFANDARLRKRRADLLEKRAQDSRVAKDIEIVQKRLLTARERWGEMDLEERRAFIRLITRNVTLDMLSTRFMRLRIEWSFLLSGDYCDEYVLLLRGMGAGAKWTPKEDALLRELYPEAPKSDILAAFPRRSWASIKLRAPSLPIKRPREKISPTILDSLSMEDLAVVQEYSIQLGWIEEGHTEYWGIETEEGVINSNVSLYCVSLRKSKSYG